MIQIEYLALVLTGIGLIVSILYYSMVLRNTNKASPAVHESIRHLPKPGVPKTMDNDITARMD